MGCGCSGADSAQSLIEQIDMATYEKLRELAAENAKDEFSEQRLWMVGGRPAIATGTADGKKGCVVLPYLGIPVKMCWQIKDIDVLPPDVSVRVRLSLSVAGTEYLSVTLLAECKNLVDPSTCSVTIEDQKALTEAALVSCNWGCLQRCAPSCISCGTDYWCWAGCAGGCLLNCCSL